MKKIVLAIVAFFAMGTMVSAQDAFENNEVSGAYAQKIESILNNLQQTDLMDEQEIGDIDLTQMQDVTNITENGALSTVDLTVTGNDRVVAAILAIFLGDFGIHHFYTGDTKHGIWHLVFFWTGIPGLIGFIEGIIWLVDEGSYPKALFGGII